MPPPARPTAPPSCPDGPQPRPARRHRRPRYGQRLPGPPVPTRRDKRLERQGLLSAQTQSEPGCKCLSFPTFHSTLPCFPPQGHPAPFTLMTLSPSMWKKLKLPAQLPTAITCPSGWKATQFRGLGQVCWEASCPRTVSHSWRREKAKRAQDAAGSQSSRGHLVHSPALSRPSSRSLCPTERATSWGRRHV